jgi:formiminoglutamate deiminase
VTAYFADVAWLGGDRIENDVLIEVDGDRISSVWPGVQSPADAVHLPGLTLPGLVNGHSHAFHRALRGRTHRAGGSFWTWRDDMYGVADALTPATLYELARATYAEMTLAGITCVGEFHYVHHDSGGRRYDDPNAMGRALVAAARDAGIRITLLDACYLTGGIDRPLEGPQLRFGDGDAAAWAERVSALHDDENTRIGAAIHSVRAVPVRQLTTVDEWAEEHGRPVHVHLSEQRAENEQTLVAHGRTPTQVLADRGVLGERTTAIHATHVTVDDIALLGGSRTTVCLCPTTERDLADGIGPGRALADAGSPLSVGSDSQAVIDVFEEARGVELHERLATGQRGHWPAPDLLDAATSVGAASLGWPDAGRLAPGALADFITVRQDSVRLAGESPETLLESLVFAATSADVRDVVVGGQRVVAYGRQVRVGDVPAALTAAIGAVLP